MLFRSMDFSRINVESDIGHPASNTMGSRVIIRSKIAVALAGAITMNIFGVLEYVFTSLNNLGTLNINGVLNCK